MPTNITVKLSSDEMCEKLADLHGCLPAAVKLIATATYTGPQETPGPAEIHAEIDTTMEALTKAQKRTRRSKAASE